MNGIYIITLKKEDFDHLIRLNDLLNNNKKTQRKV